MSNISRHKVFISYYHNDDQYYKDFLIKMKEYDYSKSQYISIFDDYSVHEDEIDDTDMTDEQIRCEIRDKYIKNATVLILLCGQNTYKRKHIDWEIHAAMYDSEVNPKMGILVINLPSISNVSNMLACGKDEENAMGENIVWSPASKDISFLRKNYPYMPERIIKNMARENVTISVANWQNICHNINSIKLLIDNAYNRKDTNCYDHSAHLQRRNL